VHPKGKIFYTASSRHQAETKRLRIRRRTPNSGRVALSYGHGGLEVSILGLNLPFGQITKSRIPSSFHSHPQFSCVRTLAGSTIEMIVRFVMLIPNARAEAGTRRRAVVTNIVTSFRGTALGGLTELESISIVTDTQLLGCPPTGQR
jgi:hypothetical protein